MNLDYVVYVYETTHHKQYTREKVTINQTNGTWSAKSISKHATIVEVGFKTNFPYRLNIRP